MTFLGRVEQILHIDLVFLLLTFADFFLSGKEINTINPKIIVYYIFLVGIIFESFQSDLLMWNNIYVYYLCVYVICMYIFFHF